MVHFRKQLTNAAPHYYSVLLLFILFIKTLFKSLSPEIHRHGDSHQMVDNLVMNETQGQTLKLSKYCHSSKKKNSQPPKNSNLVMSLC